MPPRSRRSIGSPAWPRSPPPRRPPRRGDRIRATRALQTPTATGDGHHAPASDARKNIEIHFTGLPLVVLACKPSVAWARLMTALAATIGKAKGGQPHQRRATGPVAPTLARPASTRTSSSDTSPEGCRRRAEGGGTTHRTNAGSTRQTPHSRVALSRASESVQGAAKASQAGTKMTDTGARSARH